MCVGMFGHFSVCMPVSCLLRVGFMKCVFLVHICVSMHGVCMVGVPVCTLDVIVCVGCQVVRAMGDGKRRSAAQSNNAILVALLSNGQSG